MPLPDFGAFHFPQPLDVALAIRHSGGALELRGTIDGRAAGECARCLEPVDLPLHLEIDERVDPESGRDDPLGEGNVLRGEELDVADLTRQQIDSALPLVLACSNDCPGLCPQCGRKRAGSATNGGGPDGSCTLCGEPDEKEAGLAGRGTGHHPVPHQGNRCTHPE
ncbi:MAG: YceD family protein [Candidatus Eremiobacteraeota bacterium]|nr:YceD family protein [Candidatus Eremiobacteraeota bacterium]